MRGSMTASTCHTELDDSQNLYNPADVPSGLLSPYYRNVYKLPLVPSLPVHHTSNLPFLKSDRREFDGVSHRATRKIHDFATMGRKSCAHIKSLQSPWHVPFFACDSLKITLHSTSRLDFSVSVSTIFRYSSQSSKCT
jgi:hypothetical protein